MNKSKWKVKPFNNEWIIQNKRFNLWFDLNLLLLSAASLLVVWILLLLDDWTDLFKAVEPLDLLSELVDSID